MQDWITDSHDAFRQTLKTATQLHAEEFMMCETCKQQPWFSFFFDGTETIASSINHTKSSQTLFVFTRDTQKK